MHGGSRRVDLGASVPAPELLEVAQTWWDVAEVLAEGLAACDFPPTGEEASPNRVAATLKAARLAVDPA